MGKYLEDHEKNDPMWSLLDDRNKIELLIGDYNGEITQTEEKAMRELLAEVHELDPSIDPDQLYKEAWRRIATTNSRFLEVAYSILQDLITPDSPPQSQEARSE